MDDCRENIDTIKTFHLMQDVGLGNDTAICQYMKLEYLKKILETGTYYVKRKEFFVDKREKKVPLKLAFEISSAGSKLTPEQIRKQVERTQAIRHYERESSLLLTSCWTERITENALMWDRGAERDKVCIKTTVGDFVAAFTNNKYEIWCGKILYAPINPVLLTEDIIWNKEPYFSDEREIRFYFSKNFDNIVPDGEQGEGVFLPVKKKPLIHEIVLSPYIDKETAKGIIRKISVLYGIKTTMSKIEL